MGSLILHRNSIYNIVYPLTSMGLPSAFKMYDPGSVRLYSILDSLSVLTLAISIYSKLCLLEIFARTSYQIAWLMMLTHKYEAIKCETSRKPSIRENPTEFLSLNPQRWVRT